MTTLVLRGTKGSALTFTELDNNFTNLDTDLATATTALGDYLPLTGGTLTGNVTVTSTDAGVDASPEIDLFRNSATPANGDYLGQVKFTGENDASQSTVYAKITGKISDVTDGTEDGLIEYAVKKDGTNTIVQRLTGTALKLINGAGLEVAGNITVDGTVDGRDVATDGTKLDGIANNATAYADADADSRVDAGFTAKSTSNLSEGTNLYYTNARADARIAAASTSDLSEGTNLYYTNARADARIAAADTDDLSEGTTNLYFTDARANSRVDAGFTAKSTSDLSEGTNLYFTTARADARVDAGFTAKSTSDLSEGTNLYYTNARADARIAAASTSDLSEGTNLYFTDARADARISAADTDDLSEGTTNLYFTDARANTRADAQIAAASIFALTDVASGVVVTNLNANKVGGFLGIGVYNAAGTLLNG